MYGDALWEWWERGRLDAPADAHVAVTGGDPVLGCRHRVGEAAVADSAWSGRGRPRAAGLCAAVARAPDEWRSHPQGRALADALAVTIRRIGDDVGVARRFGETGRLDLLDAHAATVPRPPTPYDRVSR
jgi:hypothetical protein